MGKNKIIGLTVLRKIQKTTQNHLSEWNALEPEEELNEPRAIREELYLLWLPLLWVPSKSTTAPITSPEVVETVFVTSPWQKLARRKESKMVRSMLELLSD